MRMVVWNCRMGLARKLDALLELRPDLASSLEWVLPLRITGPMSFTLLAVWAMNHRASNKRPGEGQLRQVDRAIDLFDNQLRTGPLVVAGGDPTIYRQSNTIDGPTFHIDYCFVPAAWTNHIRVDVGAFADWVGIRLSDHVPLTIDIDPHD